MATPLNCLLVLEDGPVKTPADLAGRKVGFSVGGVEEAVLGAVLARVVAEVLGARLPGHPLTGLAWVPGELWVFVLALAVATLAVVMPAWRAYRVDVAGVLSRA